MLYREIVQKQNLRLGTDTASRPGSEFELPILSEVAIKDQLRLALSLATTNADVRLRIIILNNLAFAEVIADNPNFEEAHLYLGQMDEIMANANEEQSLLFSGVLPHINETKVMLGAKQARVRRDPRALAASVKELLKIGESDDLVESEKRSFLSHLGIVNRWIEELTANAGEA